MSIIPTPDLSNLLPDPHSIVGSWVIVLCVILAVVASALSLRMLAPIKPSVYPDSPNNEMTDTRPVALAGKV